MLPVREEERKSVVRTATEICYRGSVLGVLVVSSMACSTSSTPSGPSAAPRSPTPPAVTAPSVRSLSPETLTVGIDDITITITGSGFQVALSFAVWSGSGVETDLLSTRYISDTQLTAVIPAKLLKEPASAHVSVVNGDSMAWSDGYRRYPESNALPIDVVETIPSIRSLSPTTAIAGSREITITITGSGFQTGRIGNFTSSFAVWSASGLEAELLTRYVSETQLTAVIPANLLNDPASARVRVVNGDSMGWSDGYRGYPKSNALSFAVVDSR